MSGEIAMLKHRCPWCREEFWWPLGCQCSQCPVCLRPEQPKKSSTPARGFVCGTSGCIPLPEEQELP